MTLQTNVFNLILFAFSILFLIGSWMIDVPESRNIALFSSPVVIPMFSSICMIILSLVILNKEHKQREQAEFGLMKPFVMFSAILLLFLLLMKIVHFYILSFAFLLTTFRLFRVGSWVKCIGISVGLIIALGLVFEMLFGILLP
ncbi:tripartite tricarboxylate transporter TctB family protein [Sporosarcina sp. 179-K 3D1 HS]|uniref:tripartite tricarboxylate transporter TctB family protein n=1 Tax=Sporosarcina sp. 179-K 3D1 HS TaxID=3232169 RepID=UPI0039A271DD